MQFIENEFNNTYFNTMFAPSLFHYANVSTLLQVDGSVVVYDLDEPSSMHSQQQQQDGQLPIRQSTYTTGRKVHERVDFSTTLV